MAIGAARVFPCFDDLGDITNDLFTVAEANPIEEVGHGFRIEGGMATGTHSTKNLPLLLAGGGFKLGDHKVYPEEKPNRLPAANLLLSMAQNFGLEIDHFGTSTGTLRNLDWS